MSRLTAPAPHERTTAAGRLWRAALAVLLLTGWLLAAAGPAAAQVYDYGVESPSADEIVRQPTDLTIYVDRGTMGAQERVKAFSRLVGSDGQPVSRRVVEYTEHDVTDIDGGSQRLRFPGHIDPFALVWLEDGGVAANGRYLLQVAVETRANNMSSPRSEWRSHPLTLDAPPPPPAGVTAEPQSYEVTVSWEAVPVPDVVSYGLERRAAGTEEWAVVASDIDPALTSVVDVVPEYGGYHYRVSVARASADPSQTHTAVSAPVMVIAKKPEAESPEERERRKRNRKELEEFRKEVRAEARRERAKNPGSSVSSLPGSLSGANPAPFVAPPDANQTYKGPLDYGVDVTREVTERVPVEVAQGTAAPDDGGVLRVLSRTIEDQRVLRPLAGGLVFLLSAAHVIRFLND